MELFLVALVGLCFGSFVTMASYRLPRDLSIVTPRSACTNCKNILNVKDLIPLVSWFLSGRKCRHCESSISWRYPAIEVVTAIFFSFIYLNFGINLSSIIFILLGVTLLVMIVSDLETKLIPDEIHYLLLIIGAFYHWHLGSSLLAIFVCFAFAGGLGLLLHYGYYFIRKRHGLGFGDVKFLFVAGFWLASFDLFAVFIFYSGVIGIFMGIVWKFFTKDPRFPFGPALAISLFLLVVFPGSEELFWNTFYILLFR